MLFDPVSFVLSALVLLFIKHFIVDFPLQVWSYQYENKGTYGHPGGLLHSGLHALGTFLVFFLIFGISVPSISISLCLGAIDGIIHYHTDWAKVKINKKKGWGPTTHHQFWILLGVDQLIHSLTYIFLVSLLTLESFVALFS